VLGEEAAQKVAHAQRDDILQPSQKTDVAALYAEARSRADLGVARGGKRQASECDLLPRYVVAGDGCL
jgi:hypothetical protein